VNRLSIGIAILALAVMACMGAPQDGTDGQPALGGAAAIELCNAANPASLPVIVQQIEQIEETADTAPLVAALATTLTLVQQLQLEADSEAASWQAAGVDAIQQLQRRMDDPERRPAVADHAARTLGILQSQICP